MSTPAVDKPTLQKFHPFDRLSDSHLGDVLRKLEVRDYPIGKILFKRGEADPLMHYLVAGNVDLADAEFKIEHVTAGTERARHSLGAQGQHITTGITKSPVVIASVKRDFVDLVLTWHEAGNYVVTDLAADEVMRGDQDWMSHLLQSAIFSQIPPANIQKLFARFEEVHYRKDDVVVRQGDAGDYFYVMKAGTAVISRRMMAGGETKDLVLAELHTGDVFGEDALIGDSPRNANVIMIKEGSLMRLGKDDFESLMEKPVLRYVEYSEFVQMANNPERKVELLDVRLPMEFAQGHVRGALNVPVHALRTHADGLDVTALYVTTCDGGRRSALAAYILSQSGLEAMILRNVPGSILTAA